jgi:hypothetical protein
MYKKQKKNNPLPFIIIQLQFSQKKKKDGWETGITARVYKNQVVQNAGFRSQLLM